MSAPGRGDGAETATSRMPSRLGTGRLDMRMKAATICVNHPMAVLRRLVDSPAHAGRCAIERTAPLLETIEVMRSTGHAYLADHGPFGGDRPTNKVGFLCAQWRDARSRDSKLVSGARISSRPAPRASRSRPNGCSRYAGPTGGLGDSNRVACPGCGERVRWGAVSG